MITLVTGKPDSGKSKRAEDLASSFGGTVYYVATMKVMDETGRLRVEKHRRMREGKGFVTIEKEVNITSILAEIDVPNEAVVLLECMANLVGNEMHSGALRKDLCTYLVEQIVEIGQNVRELVVVTSEYEPEESDDEDTALYKKTLSAVNMMLRDTADVIIDTKTERDYENT